MYILHLNLVLLNRDQRNRIMYTNMLEIIQYGNKPKMELKGY